jgi:hypothetical protein
VNYLWKCNAWTAYIWNCNAWTALAKVLNPVDSDRIFRCYVNFSSMLLSSTKAENPCKGRVRGTCCLRRCSAWCSTVLLRAPSTPRLLPLATVAHSTSLPGGLEVPKVQKYQINKYLERVHFALKFLLKIRFVQKVH